MAETRRPRRPSPRARGARRPAPQAPDLDGPVVELDVERVAHGGVFVAHHEGRVVFVSDAIPGERVSARITDRTHDRFWRAETLEVLQASPDRQAHVWAEASVERAPGDRAGGAEFGHIRIGRQRELKGDVLREALARMGGVEVDVEVREVDASLAPGVTPDGTGWRTRLRLQVGEDGVVGPYAARSHTVVPVASVPLAVPALADLAPLGARFPGARAIDLVAPSRRRPRDRGGRGRADAARPAPDDRGAGGRPRVPARPRRLLAGAPRRGGHPHASGAGPRRPRPLRSPRREPRPLRRRRDCSPRPSATGSARRCGSRRSSPTHARPSTRARTSPTGSGRARSPHGSTGSSTNSPPRPERGSARGSATPPSCWTRRAPGAGRAVVDRLAELRPRQLVYVACDPVALARDVGLLRERGYELAALARSTCSRTRITSRRWRG